jgi:hypothetical protein
VTRQQASETHVHRWSTDAFALEDERPLARQSCACGAARTIRAWERYWTPGEVRRTTHPSTPADRRR